jgi:hypothetical protein
VSIGPIGMLLHEAAQVRSVNHPLLFHGHIPDNNIFECDFSQKTRSETNTRG